MNHKLVAKVLGAMLVVEGMALMVPTIYSAFSGDGTLESFLLAAFCCFGIGVPLAFMDTTGMRMQRRDGFVCVGLCWILLGALGAIPYVISGATPSYVDALFEAISGFTTTGASIFPSVEDLPKSILLWRSMTNWMGGMGVLVMLLALLPKMGDGSANLMRAECPGPVMSKLVPRATDTAKILYLIYIGLTVAQTIVLCLLGMPLFDSINHSFATIATGGFSVKNTSIAYYQSEAINWTVTAFMFLSGINFSLLYMALRRRWKESVRSEELWFYLGSAVASTALISIDLVRETGTTVMDALSKASFQSVTIMTTTGFATSDFAAWPAVSQCVLILLMMMGGCAGSTAGGMKVCRVGMLCKQGLREIRRTIQPRKVQLVRFEGKTVEEDTLHQVAMFFFMYLLMILLGGALLALEGKADFQTNLTAALTCVSNVGPGLGEVGPAGGFSGYGPFGKLLSSFLMLAGRLEIFPMLALFHPAMYRK